MRTLRIRTFTLLSLFLILSIPWLFFVTTHFMVTKSLSLGDRQPLDSSLQKHLTDTIQLIELGADNWTNPDWQNELNLQLRQAKFDVAIFNASDQEIYRSSSERNRALSKKEQFSVIEDGQILGRAVIYLPNLYAIPMVGAFAGLLLSFFIVAMEIRRFILIPLYKMNLAARWIADGDLEVELPSSRITEIAGVRDGFDVMVRGLQKSHQKQVKLEEERRFVIAAVAHDLRTPLFALRGYLDGIEQGIAQTPEKLAKYVTVCKEKSAQLDRLVEDLFTFTKMEYLEAKLNLKPMDLKLLLQKAMDSLKPIIEQKQIVTSVRYSPDDLTVIGDSHLLDRAISNLLDNAIRHTPLHGKIVVRCDKEDHKIAFTILDSGPGFTSEELQHVFEPLYRGEASRNRSTGGAGLGLTISQRIIRQHGGELTASNHPDGGALLVGWIPNR